MSASAGANSASDERQGSDSESSTIVQSDGPGSAAGTGAGLASTVGTNALTGLAMTVSAQEGTTAESGGFARATYDVKFEVTETQQFHFGGLFRTLGNDASHVSFWAASLTNAGGSLFNFMGADDRIHMVDGLLTAGLYEFVVMSTSFSPLQRTSGDTRGGFAFNLAFSDPGAAATPEPASLLLLGTGLAGLVARRKMARS